MSELMTTGEAAEYLRYRGVHRLRSLYRFIQKKGVPTRRRFRTVLIKKSDIDRALGASPRQSQGAR